MFSRLPAYAAALAALLTTGLAGAGPDAWRAEWPHTDFSKHTVDLSEISSGGSPKDGIPAIDDPHFTDAEHASAAYKAALGSKEPVIALDINGDARAYPLRVMVWHEIVNDEVGGLPVAITYCPLCNSALAFEREINGTLLDFGTTGKLMNSNLIMYDRQTESWWQQFTGAAITGKMTGTQLKLVPARLTSFSTFRKRHPDGRVLVPENPGARPYWRTPYAAYDAEGKHPFLFSGDVPPGIDPMARVVIVKKPEGPRAWSLALVREKTRLEADGYVITWTGEQNSALDTPEITKGRDIGIVTVKKDGEDVPYDVAFAFAFHAFHPDTAIIQE